MAIDSSHPHISPEERLKVTGDAFHMAFARYVQEYRDGIKDPEITDEITRTENDVVAAIVDGVRETTRSYEEVPLHDMHSGEKGIIFSQCNTLLTERLLEPGCQAIDDAFGTHQREGAPKPSSRLRNSWDISIGDRISLVDAVQNYHMAMRPNITIHETLPDMIFLMGHGAIQGLFEEIKLTALDPELS